jgi:hypothetical protein
VRWASAEAQARTAWQLFLQREEWPRAVTPGDEGLRSCAAWFGNAPKPATQLWVATEQARR